jgi:outer membrane protein insertion porin family
MTAALLLSFVLAAAPPPAQAPRRQPAATPYVGQRIAAISATIEGHTTTDPSILDVIETRPGQPLSTAAVRESIAHLYSLGRFEDVRVDAEFALDGGVNLRYELQPIHTVSRVIFRGTLGLSEDALRRRMTDRFGATPGVGRADDVAQTLEDYYHANGYLSATVKAGRPIIEHNPDRATLVFNVQSGSRARITDITIAGTPLDPRAQILSKLGTSPGSLYVPASLTTALDQYVVALRHRGYYQASATAQPAVTADRTGVALTVNIEPGPLVTVRYEGDQIPRARLADLVPIEREGSVDQDLLEDSARRIADYLRQQGYWKASVPPPDRVEQDDHLTIVFHITRGALYHVAPGGLDVTGNLALWAGAF